MVAGHELGMAEDEGLEGDAKGDRMTEVRDAVMDEIGWERFTRVLIDTDFEMSTDDKDAVVDEALRRSGYNDVRARLFP